MIRMTPAADGTRRFGIDAGMLRILAMLFMLCDHLWISVIPGNHWMTLVGRLAFPIFAFQIAEGYAHTRNFRNYALRLLIFALISEIPFDLFAEGELFFPFHQNVIFTLLLGLLSCRMSDKILTAKKKSAKIGYASLLLLCILGGFLGMTDYYGAGVLTVFLFHIARKLPLTPLWQLLGMLTLHWFLMEGECMQIGPLYVPVQAFAVFALLPIWLYNGKPAKWSSPVFRYAAYVFYPLHMLLLYLIAVYVI